MARRRPSHARPDTSSTDGPVRTCVGCRKRAAKHELLRVTAGSGPDGRAVAVPDPTSTAAGRGAHLHPTPTCYDLAVRRKAFGRALRVPAGLSADQVGEYVATLTPGGTSSTDPPVGSSTGTNHQDWSSSS